MGLEAVPSPHWTDTARPSGGNTLHLRSWNSEGTLAHPPLSGAMVRRERSSFLLSVSLGLWCWTNRSQPSAHHCCKSRPRDRRCSTLRKWPKYFSSHWFFWLLLWHLCWTGPALLKGSPPDSRKMRIFCPTQHHRGTTSSCPQSSKKRICCKMYPSAWLPQKLRVPTAWIVCQATSWKAGSLGAERARRSGKNGTNPFLYL